MEIRVKLHILGARGLSFCFQQGFHSKINRNVSFHVSSQKGKKPGGKAVRQEQQKGKKLGAAENRTQASRSQSENFTT